MAKISASGVRSGREVAMGKLRAANAARLRDLQAISREWKWEHGSTKDAIGRAVAEQLQTKMGDIKFNIAQEVREALVTQRRFGTGGDRSRSGGVQSSTPHVTKRTNSRLRDTLSVDYSGESPKNRIKGKGRSANIEDIYKPSLEFQPGDPASRRIGSLSGSQGTGTQSLTTGLFSRFGANKSDGTGFGAASASRLRGAKNLMAHPETWMKRYAWFWIAAETEKGIENWRGWNNVSFDMSNQEARSAMGTPSPISESIVRGVSGAVTGGVMGALRPTVGLGAMIGAGLGLGSEEEAARAVSMYEATRRWAGNGFKGKAPWNRMADAEQDAIIAGGNARDEAKRAAKEAFNKSVTDGLVRVKDVLALRGVGGVNDVARALKGRKDFKQYLADQEVKGLGAVNDEKIIENALNKQLKGLK